MHHQEPRGNKGAVAREVSRSRMFAQMLENLNSSSLVTVTYLELGMKP